MPKTISTILSTTPPKLTSTISSTSPLTKSTIRPSRPTSITPKQKPTPTTTIIKTNRSGTLTMGTTWQETCETILGQLNTIKIRLNAIEFSNLKEVGLIKNRQDDIETRMKQMETRMENIEEMLGRLCAHFKVTPPPAKDED